MYVLGNVLPTECNLLKPAAMIFVEVFFKYRQPELNWKSYWNF